MDQTLELKLKDFQKSLKTLEEVLAKKKNDIVRDSTIKRFEYAYELCWKTCKIYLREIEGFNVFSPKECFRKLLLKRLISEKDTETLLLMTDERNEIIHTYNKKYANALYKNIAEKYYKLMKKVYREIKR